MNVKNKRRPYLIVKFMQDVIRIVDLTISDLYRTKTIWEKCSDYYDKKDICNYFLWNNAKISSIIKSDETRELIQSVSKKDYMKIYQLFISIPAFVKDCDFDMVLSNYRKINNILNSHFNKKDEHD